MPSLVHEAVLHLFRNRPLLAPELLRDALHAPLPPFERVRVGDTNLTELVPTEFRADLVLLLEGEVDTPPRCAIVIEAQLGMDADKLWSWPVYLTTLRARLRCDAVLVVVTVDEAVAAWAARLIETGHPGFGLAPLVLGPGSVPLVLDEAEAVRAPERAVLSALVHAHTPKAAELARAALVAVRGLDDERARSYVDLVLASLDDAARTVLEALMASRDYEYQSDFAKRYYGEGRAEGLAEGTAKAVMRVLEVRGIEVPADLRTRILGCTDLALLDAWLARAATATSAAEVVAE